MFIKIDVEGAEYDVLRGAIKTLTMSPRPTWFIEICLSEFHPSEMNPNFAATFDLFWKNGYEVLMANKENRRIKSVDIMNWVSNKSTDLKGFNYLFIPKK